jgi:hypothetical protein
VAGRFLLLEERGMQDKKAPPKRSNGSAKPETSKTKSSKTPTKVRSKLSNPINGIDVYLVSDEQIAARAYLLWEHRGRPVGSPEEDWYRAKQELYAAQERSNS